MSQSTHWDCSAIVIRAQKFSFFFFFYGKQKRLWYNSYGGDKKERELLMNPEGNL